MSMTSSKKPRTELGSVPSKKVALVVTRKPRLTASLMPSTAMSYPPSRQTEKSWCSRWPSRWTEKVRYLDGVNSGRRLLEFERVGAEVDVLFARDEAVDDLDDLRVEQRLAAGDGDHGRAALFNGGEALLGRELLFEDVRRVLHLAAAGAGQVAAEERLEHEHQRIALVAAHALLEHIGGDRPHLGDRDCHCWVYLGD